MEWHEEFRDKFIYANKEAIQIKNENIPKSLYKYYSFHENKIETLKNNKIHFSEPKGFNDPFDCSCEVLDPNVIIDEIRRKSGLLQIDKYYFDKGIEILKKTIDEINNGYITCCFSEDYKSILMWSHYANSHNGFCIEYNLLESPQRVINSLYPILYNDYRPNLTQDILKYINDHQYVIGNIIFSTYLNKAKVWSYEREWRIIHSKNLFFRKDDIDKSGKDLNIECKPKGIYVGLNAEPDRIRCLKSIAKQYKCLIYKMEKSKDKFELYEEVIGDYR